MIPKKIKISNYRPYAILARDPKESTYEVGDDKFTPIADVREADFAEELVRRYNECKNDDSLLQQWFELRVKALSLKERELEEKKRLDLYHLSSIEFLKEFGTLNLNFGRMTGCSYFITNFLMEKFKEKCLVITFNSKVSENLISRTIPKPDLENVYSIRQFMTPKTFEKIKNGIKPEYIVVDASLVFEKSQTEYVYSAASDLKAKLVILC